MIIKKKKKKAFLPRFEQQNITNHRYDAISRIIFLYKITWKFHKYEETVLHVISM